MYKRHLVPINVTVFQVIPRITSRKGDKCSLEIKGTVIEKNIKRRFMYYM